MLDHYAHLGGALFGVFWYKYGAEIWYSIRVWDLPVAFYLHSRGTDLTPRDRENNTRSS